MEGRADDPPADGGFGGGHAEHEGADDAAVAGVGEVEGIAEQGGAGDGEREPPGFGPVVHFKLNILRGFALIDG